MGELPQEIKSELDHIRATLENLDAAVKRPQKGVIESAAIGTFLHNFYTGMEHVIRHTLRAHNVPLPESETWHKDLLELALQETILSEETVEYLYEFLGFRHFFVHGYAQMLQEPKLISLANNANKAWERFLTDIREFYRL